MDVVYKPEKENVVADWLSRALMINTILKGTGETSEDVRQFLPEWMPEGDGKHSAPGSEGEQLPGEEKLLGGEISRNEGKRRHYQRQAQPNHLKK